MSKFKVYFYAADKDQKVFDLVTASNIQQACHIAHLHLSTKYGRLLFLKVVLV